MLMLEKDKQTLKPYPIMTIVFNLIPLQTFFFTILRYKKRFSCPTWPPEKGDDLKCIPTT